jgi:WD40 repeat protein/serine/threonine protein kinase
MIMPKSNCCAECGTPLPEYWPKGLCTQCALDGALDLTHAGSQVRQPEEVVVVAARTPPSSPLGSFGEYELLEEIARGGMGVVYKARQKNLGRIVAVKMILAGSMAGKEFVRRFRTESAAAAILQHPNIVAIHDVGVHEGRHYFSMDYVEGQNLAQLVGQQSLPPATAARYVEAIATAIHYAHERGILHRDLKPSNVLIESATDQPRITDFGLARRLDGESSLTLTGQVLGSPNFMPPEQAGGGRGKVGRPSDVYALGGILYHLLTARAPFQADSLDRLLTQVLHAEPVSPRLLNPSIPRDLETITLKCLEKEPSRRYQTAQELADELARFLRHEPIRARPLTPPERLWRWGQRKPTMALLIVLLHLVGAVGLTGIVWQWQRAERLAKSEGQQRERFETGESNALRQLYVAKMNLAQQAWEQNHLDRLGQILDETESYSERGFEWYFWQRQTHLELKTLRGHGGPIIAAAYSPDGRRIVTGSADATARVWDEATGKELLSLVGHTASVRAVAFSSNGQWIVTGSTDGRVAVWSAATGANLLTFNGQSGRIFSVAFSPDNKWIASGGEDPIARIWSATSGNSVSTLKGHEARVLSVAFSPDGQRVVTSSWDNTAKVFEAASGKELLTLNGHGNAVFSVAFSPDGERIVTGSWDHSAKVWEAADGQVLFTLRGHSAPVVTAAFSPDGQWIVTAGDDQTARVWDVRSPIEPLVVKRHGSPISSVAFSPDGQRILSAGGAPGFSPDGQEISSGRHDYTAKVWEAFSDRGLLTLKGHREKVMSVAVSRDGTRIVTGSFDQTAKVWEAATGRELHHLIGHTGAIRSVTISPDGQRIATGSWDRTVKVWDAASGKLLRTFDQHSILFMAVSFSPDSQRIVACGQDHLAKVWNVASGAEELTIRGKPGWIWSAVYSPDGQRILTANEELPETTGTAEVWDATTGTNLLTLKGHTSYLFAAVFSADGRRILTAGGHDQTAKVWDAATGTNLLTLEGHSGWVMSAGFSPDGQRIVTGSQDGTAKVWDASSGKELLTFKGHRGWVFSVAFSLDARRLVTGSEDGTARIWETASVDQLAGWRNEEQTAVEDRAARERERAAAAERERALLAQDPRGIKQWLVLLPIPFEGKDGARALREEQLLGESRLRPRAGERIKVGQSELVWRQVSSEDYLLDFNRLAGAPTGYQVAYAVCTIQSEAAQSGLLLKIASDDQARVYLNGKLIYECSIPRSYSPVEDTAEGIDLKAGTNVLIFKVVNETRYWQGSIRLTDAAGQPVKGIRDTPTPP